jgi:hypothetical protein
MERRQFLESAAADASMATLFSQAAAAGSGDDEAHDVRVPSFDGAEIASTVFLPGENPASKPKFTSRVKAPCEPPAATPKSG